jgi:signal transduction histidine kinase
MPCPEHEKARDRGWLEERGPSAAAPPGTGAASQTRLDPEPVIAAELIAEERARIGRDLHDLVIRRLFAVSLKLSGALSMIEQEEPGRRVDEAIADLDQTVKLIRSVVFCLGHSPPPQIHPDAAATGASAAPENAPSRADLR